MGDFNSYGTAYKTGGVMAISFKEGAGALWWRKKLRLTPRFELRMKIKIPNHGCYDGPSYSIDGFALILSKTNNYLGYSNNDKGYGGIFNALVTEIDLNANPGEISSNFVNLRECYGITCRASNGKSSSANIPFSYNRCSLMTYDVKIKYDNKRFMIYVNDYHLINSYQDLFSKFDGFSWFGLSGYFKGNQRELVVGNDSYICTDSIRHVEIITQYNGLTFNSQIPNNIPAGTTIDIIAKFTDMYKQVIPHFKADNLIDWNLTTSYDCGKHGSSWDPNKFLNKESFYTKVKEI